jgi:ABC-2 type transport system permease protein
VRPPAFLTQLGLLWGLQLRTGLNRGRPGGWWLQALALGLSVLPGVALALAAYRLLGAEAVRDSPVWPDFLLRLLCFVTTCVGVAWPVLSAGVDDHAELSRYAAFPISSLRLLLASTLASVVEPRALVFLGPLVGATLGALAARPPAHPALLALVFAAYVLFNAALSRVGLYLVLSVLRQARSAELLGGGFAVALALASVIPPVDTSWLVRLGQAGAAAVPDTLLADATLALGRFPTGRFAHALSASAQGRLQPVVDDLGLLVALTSVALVVAHGLLLDFHRQAGRGGARTARQRRANPFARSRSLFTTLVLREALDLWHNPRFRLVLAVPFVLGILLKLLSARALLVFALGDAADAWALGGACVYGAVVLTATFSQNAFAYDGQGLVLLLTSPVELGQVLRAKNLVHGGAGAALAAGVGVFYLASFGPAGLAEVAVAAAWVATVLPVVLAAGNFLSVSFPVKFHVSLQRRDRLPFAASMLGVAAAGAGAWPLFAALRLAGTARPGALVLLAGGVSCAVAWGLYLASWPLAVARLGRRRELVLQAVTRDSPGGG